MRISIILTLLFSASVFAATANDKSMQELFQKYDQVMDFKKTELIDEVFTAKFIKESGGKEELIAKIKELPTPSHKNYKAPKPNWRKALKGNLYFAKVKDESSEKSKKDNHEAEYLVKEEDGKLKIDGTIGDAN